MTDRDALYAAILAHPEEDTPRLAFADWLDENGDDPQAAGTSEGGRGLACGSNAARAEFVRIQIERARLRYGSREYLQRNTTLATREGELFRANREAWAEELRLPARPRFSLTFRRGFASGALATAADFVASGAALVAAAPIESVEYHRANRSNMPDLATAPAFYRVPGVVFDPDESDPASVAAVPLGHLRAITVMPCFGASEGDNAHLGPLLVSRPDLNDLKWLRLRGAGLGDEGADAFARAPRLAGLELLDLSNNGVAAGTAARLRAKYGGALVLTDADRTRFTLHQLDQLGTI